MNNEEILIDVVASEEENGEDEGPSQPKKSRCSFTLKKKIEVIEYRRKNSMKNTCERFKIVESNVHRWMRQEKQLRDLLENSSKTNPRKRLDGSGRPLRNKNLDEQLIEWVRDKRASKQRISRRIIQQQAMKLFEEEEGEDNIFKASIGWLQKFLIRHKLSIRRPTTVCQKPPIEYADVIAKFILYVRQLRTNKSFHHIYAADETAFWLDCGGYTIERKGAKDVSVLTTGHDKVRITVMLTARSDGFKCKPFVLLNRKRPIMAIENKFKHHLHLIWAGKSWMDDQLTEEYLMKVFGAGLFFNRLLVWDSFRCHLSESTKKVLRKIKLDTAVVPGGCTKFVQAPDLSWNGPVKAAFRRQYEDWMLHGEKETTASGNPRAAPMAEYLQWLLNAWNELPQDTIVESFKSSGITNAVDGSEDDMIHCFKPEGPIPDGRESLRNAEFEGLMDELGGHFNEIDLLQDEENGFLSDESLEL